MKSMILLMILAVTADCGGTMEPGTGGGSGSTGGGSGMAGWRKIDPPYHYDVYVITHHPRDPLVMEGGTTFHFVTDGIESALEQAKASAGGKDVMAWGGGQTISEYLAAGLVDELELHVVPIVLGGGASLWSELGGPTQFELVRVVEAPGVTHLKYWTTD